jgi:hypothetical protein
MALGPGKYDDIATEVRQKTGTEGVIVFVINGSRGNGFSAQLPLDLTLTLPTILRDMARQIEDVGPAA